MVDAFDASDVIETMSYSNGNPTPATASYSFVQTPDCGYPETVTVIDLPGFMDHDEFSKEFTIPETYDNFWLGSYTVTLRSEI